jgi:hypothetical protein
MQQTSTEELAAADRPTTYKTAPYSSVWQLQQQKEAYNKTARVNPSRICMERLSTTQTPTVVFMGRM